MGKQRNKTIQITFLLVCLLFSLSFMSLGCANSKTESKESLVTSWVRKQRTEKGELKYPGDASVVLSAPMTVFFPDVEAFRGYINSKEKRRDGVFFIHKKNHTIQFLETNNQ